MKTKVTKRAIGWKWIVGLFGVFVVVLYLMGRVPICECGYVKLWHGDNFSSGNSQHLSDWYSFSHVIHGMLFFWLFSWVVKKTKFGHPLVWALLLEMGWEILENTPMVIDRYRATTISLDYFGDSIVNSVADVVWMMFGFWLAKRLPVKWSVVLIVVMEVFVGYMIRDNLTLNVIMLLAPNEAIRLWQAGV